MKRMSFSETVFLFVLALVIFGPKKLPEIARQLGKYMAEFRRASNEFKAQIEQEIRHIEFEERKQTILPPSPAPEGTASRGPSAVLSEAKPIESAPASAAPSAPATSEAAPAVAPASEDEPLFALAAQGEASAPNNGASPSTETVTSASSQESHA